MSLRIINNLVNYVKDNLGVDEKSVIIKTIEIVDDCIYTIELEINNNLYAIRHFEPLVMVQDVNYGHGFYYDCDIFNKEKGHYEFIKFNYDFIKSDN